jgi:hypothetical protein
MIQFSERYLSSCNRGSVPVETRRDVGQEGGSIVTKNEIIQMTLQAMGLDGGPLTTEEEEHRAIVEATLTERLPDTNFKTCEDFDLLPATCCEICHTLYPHYEMYVEDLPSGEKAWICCRVRSALFEPAHQSDDLRENFVDLERALGFEPED